MSERVFMTGATGLVGSEIALQLEKKGYSLFCLKRSSGAIPKNLEGTSINWVEGDILDGPGLESYLKETTILVHAAALVSFQPRDQKKLDEANIRGTQNLVDLALEHKIPYFMYVSSVGAIGRPVNAREVDEDAPWEENERTSHYGKTKFRGELEVWRGFAEGLKGAIVNPSVVLGPADWSRSSGQLFKYVYEGGKFYTPGSINVVDVRDVARAICILVEKKIHGQRFILNGATLPYKEFFGRIAKAMGARPPGIKVGNSFMKLARTGDWIKSLLLNKPRLITRETMFNSFSLHEFSTGKINKDLDFSFLPIEESIEWASKEMLRWNVDK